MTPESEELVPRLRERYASIIVSYSGEDRALDRALDAHITASQATIAGLERERDAANDKAELAELDRGNQALAANDAVAWWKAEQAKSTALEAEVAGLRAALEWIAEAQDYGSQPSPFDGTGSRVSGPAHQATTMWLRARTAIAPHQEGKEG